MPRLTTSQVAELITAYVAGDSITALATCYGVHRDTVRRYLDVAGKTRPTPKPISPEQVTQAIELYGQGLTLKRVGGELGFTSETIRKYLHRSGVEVRATGAR
jgi:response regulator of citrate/malate metabolism